MAKRKRDTSTVTIENRLKEGRGQGKGADYKPWLRIQDVPSNGLSSRIKGWKTKRLHHLLSNVESSFLYILDWSPFVLDIREQFPLLPLEETLAIAEQCAVVHPSDPRTKEPIVMTTDFRVTVQQETKTVEQARAIKCVKDLQSQRVLEKLEIERRYWNRREIDWGIVTERDIPNTVAKNIQWFHSLLNITDLPSLTQNDVLRIATVMAPMMLQSQDTLANIAANCDERLGLAPGLSLSVAKHLFANRFWRIDMYQPIYPDRKLKLLSAMPMETTQVSRELA